MNLICPSDKRAMRLKVSRHYLGNRNGLMPLNRSISPGATVNQSFITRPHHFLGLAVGPAPTPLKYLKNSEFGSSTIMSLRLLKLAR
jgi:hypothetical protein